MTKAPAKPSSKPFNLLAPLELTFAAGNDGDELPAKFSGVAYSGGAIPSHGAVIDLSTTKIADKLPLLDSHMRSEIIGVLASAEIADNKLSVAGELFSDVDGCAAQRIGRLSKRGAPYQLSVGLFGYRELFLPSGQTMSVNGRDVTGPMVVLQGGTVREVSIVTLGADPDTSTQFFDQPQDGEDEAMTIAELQAQVATLTAERDAAQAKTVELLAAAASAQTAARTAAIVQLAADTGEAIADAQKEVYLSMSQAQFDAAAGRERAMVARLKKANPALFQEQATDGGKPEPKVATFSVTDVYAKRAKAALAAV